MQPFFYEPQKSKKFIFINKKSIFGGGMYALNVKNEKNIAVNFLGINGNNIIVKY